jgi:hypothetical protein
MSHEIPTELNTRGNMGYEPQQTLVSNNVETHRRSPSILSNQLVPNLQQTIMDRKDIFQEEKQPSCKGCHLVFDSDEGLAMHRSWCRKRKRDEGDEPNALFNMVKEGMEINHSEWENVYDKYEDKGEERAIKRANREILPDDVDTFKKIYLNFFRINFNITKVNYTEG